jgi:hypothetical protein
MVRILTRSNYAWWALTITLLLEIWKPIGPFVQIVARVNAPDGAKAGNFHLCQMFTEAAVSFRIILQRRLFNYLWSNSKVDLPSPIEQRSTPS